MIQYTYLDKYVDDCKVALGVVVDLGFNCKGQCFVVQPLPLRIYFWKIIIWYVGISRCVTKMKTHLRHRLFLQWLRKSGKSSRVAQRFGKSAVKGTRCKFSKISLLSNDFKGNLITHIVIFCVVHVLQTFDLFFSAGVWKKLFTQDAELLPIL